MRENRGERTRKEIIERRRMFTVLLACVSLPTLLARHFNPILHTSKSEVMIYIDQSE